MQISHLSRSLKYRAPYGAVPAGTEVVFSIDLVSPDHPVSAISLCYAYGLHSFQESRIMLQPLQAGMPGDSVGQQSKPHTWRISLRMPGEAGLFFYWFEIDHAYERIYYTADHDSLEGGGIISQHRPRFHPGEAHHPAAWQVTLYEPDFNVPEWLIGAVIYQIFPDRYNRDKHFSLDRFSQNEYPERIYHEDWQEDVDFHGKLETGYLACDFYGGSLAGIEEKLPEIAEMGVDVVYLNPIFRARSNHRYDTGDYEQIDPLLGTEEDFVRLCQSAEQKEIRVMLDGVFSHTGADSRYFNKLERYSGTGAYQEAMGKGYSPYSSWYIFHRRGEQLFYDSWWGFQDLPSVNEHDLTYQDYISGSQGIIRRWLRLGAAGWRLDVSDELPDSFLRTLRRACKSEKHDAALMGEVWEDASCKISYGNYRDFLFGRTHDNIMGYPFQQALTGWLAGHFAADRLAVILEGLRERYPIASFYSNFNLISSHDIPRAITAMAGKPDPGNREAQASIRLTAEERRKGENLMRLAFFFQVMFPGAVSIYYGDEQAMEGYRDPFNRRTYAWSGKKNLCSWYIRLGQLRKQSPVLKTGYFRFLKASGSCVVICRWLQDRKDVFGHAQKGPDHILAAINSSSKPIRISMLGRELKLAAYAVLLEIDGDRVDLD